MGADDPPEKDGNPQPVSQAGGLPPSPPKNPDSVSSTGFLATVFRTRVEDPLTKLGDQSKLLLTRRQELEELERAYARRYEEVRTALAGLLSSAEWRELGLAAPDGKPSSLTGSRPRRKVPAKRTGKPKGPADSSTSPPSRQAT